MINTSNLRELVKMHSFIQSSATHRAMLISYMRFMSRNSLYSPEEYQIMYHNAADSLQGKARDYALFQLMKQGMTADLGQFELRYKKFKSDCKSPEYIRYIDSLRIGTEQLKTNPIVLNIQLETITGKRVTWLDILKLNKENIVYLDMWASWCKPCRAEMPYSRKMQTALAGKPVNFVYISIDDDRKKWLEAIRKDSLSGNRSQHYLLNRKSAL